MERTMADQDAIIITRIFAAPRERVWRAWTDADMLMKWWGPKGFTAPVWKIDPRVGGRYLYDMRSPEGRDYWGTGTYREIVPLERIVATDSFADAEGNVVPASQYGMGDDMPRELLITVTFESEGGKTRMTLTHIGFPAGKMREMATEGWNESFDKLAENLK
jgi:uncharacterized protein YndB with AHSA1/START domain